MELMKDVINTYECLLSCRKKMPGMKLEDAFTPEAVNQLEIELLFLKQFNVEINTEMKGK